MPTCPVVKQYKKMFQCANKENSQSWTIDLVTFPLKLFGPSESTSNSYRAPNQVDGFLRE